MNRLYYWAFFVPTLSLSICHANPPNLDMLERYKLSETRTASVNVNFTVEIEKKSCIISAGFQPTTENPTVHLGTVSSAPHSKGAAVPVFFVFKECASYDHISSIEFVRDLERGQAEGSIGGGKAFISTTNKDVNVYLWQDSAATKQFLKLDYPKGEPIRLGERITVCYAQAKVSSNGAKKLANFEGAGEFKVIYQ